MDEKITGYFCIIFISAIYALKHQLYIGHFTDESLTLHCNEKRVGERSLHHGLIRKDNENKGCKDLFLLFDL